MMFFNSIKAISIYLFLYLFIFLFIHIFIYLVRIIIKIYYYLSFLTQVNFFYN